MIVKHITRNETTSESYLINSNKMEYPVGYEVTYDRHSLRSPVIGEEHTTETVTLKVANNQKLIDYFLSVSVRTRKGDKMPTVMHRSVHKIIPGELADRLSELPEHVTKVLSAK